ncbi:5185_t:CDS:10 [Dentiscutata erythropus]|uniref:5185_t:CDS:1 n=1 Tax=Dentiscutata erythropus TaxID=1348616 RepID=A0A9N9AT07_9GLOM|nr:5185_t:CDS:10 [Dentiscutata erythropus]
MATETLVTPETTKNEGKLVENVVEDTIVEAEEPNFTLAINFPHFPGKTYVMANASELVQEVKQWLIDSPETCIYTCFSLCLNGRRLDDYKELQEEGITQDSRIHVIHVRDLLAGPFKQVASSVGIDPGLSFFTAVTGINVKTNNEQSEENGKSKEDSEGPKTPFTDYDFTAPSLSKFIPDNFGRHKIKCVESLYLSGWNPVPFERRRRGDLLYLIVSTIEGETLHITAGVDGFFVNRSTIKNFDFNPRTELQIYHAHSLITLLQGLSPSFRTNFKILQDFIGAHHPFETIPVNTCFPAYPWIARQSKHTYDMGRATEIYLNFGMDAVDSLRDWNDEFQSQREYPRVELRDRVLRERLINKIQADFTESAVKGAIAVINGNVIPFNPRDPEDEHMYVYNNIFFSKAFDTRGTFSKLGGNDAAHVATGKDMEGIRIVNSIDIEGLYTLGCVVIDYKGVRIVAQTIVPGIFRRQDDSSIVYGYFDNGRDDPKLCANPEFHEVVGKAAKALHLAEHSVCDTKGTTVKLYTSLETKGLMGDDGRRYLFDLYRLNPVDIEFIEKECEPKEESDIPPYPHRLVLLRPELIESYWDYRFRLWLQDKANKEKEAGDSTKEAVISENDEFNLAFNPDAFTNFNIPIGEEHAACKAADEENVRNASKYLRDTVIRMLIIEFTTLAVSPVDGISLTTTMHRRGINMRYLGMIANIINESQDHKLDHIKHLVIHEMIIRASKRILRSLLRQITNTYIPYCISHFLNCLLGTDFNMNPQPLVPDSVNDTKNLRYDYLTLTPSSLCRQICETVLIRYRYRLPEDFINAHVRKLPMLREICLRIGVQITVQGYHFLKKKSKKRVTTFIPDDILNLIPTIKQATPKCAFAEETFETGKLSIAQGSRDLGVDLMLQSLALHEQSYGFLHPATARCYSALAMCFYHNEDLEIAIDFQKKAVIVLERTCGVDSVDAIHGYLHLGLFENAIGHTELGLKYMRHAMYYWEIIFGDLHPDGATADHNVGIMLQNMKDYEGSIKFFERAKNTNEFVFGKNNVVTGESYHLLAKALAYAEDYKAALIAEKSAYHIFHAVFGAEHPRTRETELLLRDLTSNAVHNAKMALQQKQDKPQRKPTPNRTVPIQLRTGHHLNDNKSAYSSHLSVIARNIFIIM